MKGLLLAVAASLACLVIVTLGFRVREIRERAAFMARVFLLTLPVLVILPTWLDLAFSLLVYAAAFFGGILQLYNLADRGFSLRMLIDIYESPRGALTADELTRAYGGGRGIGWMYDKRLDGLLERGLVRVEGGTVEISTRGHRAARVLGRLVTFLRLDAA